MEKQEKKDKQSETISLNMRKLGSIKPGSDYTYFDTDVTGLYVRVRPRSVAYYIRARNPNRKEIVRCLWDVGTKVAPLPGAPEGQTEIEIVRDHARQFINEIKRNAEADPRDEIEALRVGGKVIRPKVGDGRGWTFRQLLEAFVASKEDLRRGHGEYRSVLLLLPELWVPPQEDPKAAPPALPHLDAKARARLRALPQSAATAITRDDIQLIRDSVTARVSARRNKAVLDYISGAYKWAHGEPVSGIPEDCNPTLGVRRGLTARQKAQVEEQKGPLRWLTMKEINHLLVGIESTACDISVRNALILDLLIAQRKGSLISAPVTAYRYDDEHGHHLAISASKTKAGKMHCIPLAPIALAFVKQQIEIARRRGSPWLFPTNRTFVKGKTLSGHLSDTTINDYLKRMLMPPPALERPTRKGRGVRQFTDAEWERHVWEHQQRYGYLHQKEVEPFTVHDFRNTITTNLTMRRLVPEWYVSVLLQHAVVGTEERKSKVTGKHYQGYLYWNEKREAAETWAALVVKAGLSEILFPLPDEKPGLKKVS